MNSSKKAWYVVAAVVVIAIVWAIWRNEPPDRLPLTVRATAQTAKAKARGRPWSKTNRTPNPTQANETFWLGTLKASDNAKKGNLLLVTDKNTVYISTSRDFSDLVRKKVKVTYQGTLDSFQLGDITAQ